MNFETVEIYNIEEIKEFDGEVYDLEVESDHSYNVNGILVHNSDFVMSGSLFAGYNESGGGLIEKEGVLFKEVYGMSSEYAMNKYYGKRDSYRASEGNYFLIPCKGKVKPFIENVLGGLKSTGSYIGAERMKDMSKCATFIRINRIK